MQTLGPDLISAGTEQMVYNWDRYLDHFGVYMEKQRICLLLLLLDVM
jgi:hypothetical protein